MDVSIKEFDDAAVAGQLLAAVNALEAALDAVRKPRSGPDQVM